MCPVEFQSVASPFASRSRSAAESAVSRVLIVDDDEDLRNLLQARLAAQGYEVFTVTTGVFNQDEGSALSAVVNTLPSNGAPVHARLWSLVAGTWQFADYSYATAPSTGAAQMVSPAAGTTLGGSAQFRWNGVAGATEYWLYVGTTFGGAQVISRSEGANLTTTVSGLPSQAGPLYVRLWSKVNGVWQFTDVVYQS